MATVNEELREVVARSARTMCEKGLTWGRDAGDTSLRDPATGYIYILPEPTERRPIPTWDVVEAQDVAVVDGDGRIVGDPEVPPTVELPTHLCVYNHRPDVQAVVHSHGTWTRVFSALREPIPLLMVDHFLYTGASPIRCATFGLAGDEEAAMSIVECLGLHGKVALLAAHGAVCVGRDMGEALSVAEIAEDAARLAIYARMLGNPQQISLHDLFGEEVLRDVEPIGSYLRGGEGAL